MWGRLKRWTWVIALVTASWAGAFGIAVGVVEWRGLNGELVVIERQIFDIQTQLTLLEAEITELEEELAEPRTCFARAYKVHKPRFQEEFEGIEEIHGKELFERIVEIETLAKAADLCRGVD
ncbi:MAG: hypothetical protein ACE5JL_16780 [Dehalococcoidia bacterium]